MFDSITVPPAVSAELKSLLIPDWVRVVSIPQGAATHFSEAGLGRGETEAIHLALHLRPDRLLILETAVEVLSKGRSGGSA
jgi:predicted nucleic acid-binding protein